MRYFNQTLKAISPTVIVALLILIFSLTPWGKIGLKSLALLSGFVPSVNFNLLDFFGEKFTVKEVEVETPSGRILANLYRPQNKKLAPATIFSLGTLGTKDSENVKRYAELFAKAGFVVLAPDIVGLVEVKMRDSTVEEMVAVFDYLYNLDFVDKNAVGFSGICAGASLSLIAAADRRIADKVAIVNVIAPYFDAKVLSFEVLSGEVLENGRQIAWQPISEAERPLKLWYLNFITDSFERELVKKIVLENQRLSEAEFVRLSLRTQNILRFLRNSDYDKFADLANALPPEVQDQLRTVSPGEKISSVKAKVYVIADIYDEIVHNSHSKKLVQSLPKDQVKLTRLKSLSHVVPEKELERWMAVREGIKLYLHIYSLISHISSN